MSRLRQRSSSWLLESPLEDRGALYIQPCSQYFFFYHSIAFIIKTVGSALSLPIIGDYGSM